MPSRTYELFREAMADRRQIVCVYQELRRELCPIILGHSGGKEVALTYQFDGETSSGPVRPPGQWRCLNLDEVSDVTLQDGAWHSGGSHSTQQVCVKEVDYDVNPHSPYAPRRRL